MVLWPDGLAKSRLSGRVPSPTSRVPWVLALLTALAAGGCEQLPNVPPTASFIFSPVSPIFAGETTVVFNASTSRDSDGNIASYVWNFGDGTPEQTAAGPSVTHVFPNTPATCLTITYAVLLTVVDDNGERGAASQNVAVTEDCRP